MPFPSGHSTVFAIVDNAAALAWVANLGCIELHTWHSRVPEIERPDYLLIDLDPTTDGQWPYVREIALVVREVMDELGLRSFPKTSGATGLHILAPIRPELPFPGGAPLREGAGARRSSGASATRRVATTTWRVADRVGVFVDFGQNARDRTIACAYSVRPTPDARVSAPLRWDEVAGVEPAAFTLETMPGAHRRGRRPDARDVAQPAVAAPRFERLGLSRPAEALLTRAAFQLRRPKQSPRRRQRLAGASARAAAARARCSRPGLLSSRQRISFVPWRKRLPCTLS